MSLSLKNLKSNAMRVIERNSEALIELTLDVLANPETGFREKRTSERIVDWFREKGLNYRSNLGITGLSTRIETGRRGPNIAILGELDGLLVPRHPHADSKTGAAHACGHHTQVGVLLGVLTGLLNDSLLGQLSGSITFMGVPAEEYIEIAYRQDLRKSGKIEFLSGKQEFLRLGEFDDIDIAFMTHTTSDDNGLVTVGGSHSGMIGKIITYTGIAAHAGDAPHNGINALNAANIGLTAIHAIRETFKDEDRIRIHPIITKGGDSVSSVPENVTLETLVRGSNLTTMEEAEKKVDFCLRAGALAVGASVEIETNGRYLPSRYDTNLQNIYQQMATAELGDGNVHVAKQKGSSSDMADLSHLMPVIHPWTHSAKGRGHGTDYLIQDYQLAVVTSAKLLTATVIRLLSNDAAAARRVINEFTPTFTKEEYLSRLRQLIRVQVYEN